METTTAAVEAALASLKLYHSQTQSTGLPGVDHVTGGMKLGELWVLAGPGSCGLTGLAVQHAAFAAGAGRRVVVVTPLENSAETLLRILGPALAVHPGQFVEPKWPRDLDTVDDLVSEVAPQLNLVAIGADREWAAVLAEILSAREPLDLLVIDDAHACPELLRNAVATTYPSVAGSSLPHTMRQLARRRRTTLLLTLSAETVASDPAWARSADVLATLEPALDPGAAGWGDVQLRFVRDKPMQATVDLTFSLRDGHLIEFAGYAPAIEQRVTSPTNLFSAEARINRGRARQRKRARTVPPGEAWESVARSTHDVLLVAGKVARVQRRNTTPPPYIWGNLWLTLDNYSIKIELPRDPSKETNQILLTVGATAEVLCEIQRPHGHDDVTLTAVEITRPQQSEITERQTPRPS